MPTWLKYTTVGPSQADYAIYVERVMLETKYVAGETVLELSVQLVYIMYNILQCRAHTSPNAVAN